MAVAALVAAAPATAQDAPPEIVPRATRNVTPPGMTPGPAVDGPLTRVPEPPKPPEPARWRRYHLPATADAATLVSGALTIRVSGVTPPPADRTCRTESGEEWPCGRTALFSFRMFLRGRAVECYLPPVGGVVQAIAPCRVGQTDLGLWLLAQGWAEPDGNATDAYREAAHAARCAGRGIWRGAPSASDGTCPAVDQDGGAGTDR